MRQTSQRLRFSADNRALTSSILADNRNVFTAESCLRRALDALLDIGRHILAKGFAIGTTEYKEVAARLGETRVLSAEDAARLGIMAGYRNRLVHFYNEVSHEELYDICRTQLADIVAIASGCVLIRN
ncbi:MAG: DUF86 domain-containing protein [Anaerolineae bacterium]|uniref:type VII toxin-antitoxin system HepT family RNase toxin n=1 Tax=Promineifilum sp. TaxID=2664178 RepID=UPI001D414E05|nr:DUF86 domain-containing protein [Anaerolineales bacterium]MCW5848011.1 DUF86 domain-containing protein [Anaerolineae bacterium]